MNKAIHIALIVSILLFCAAKYAYTAGYCVNLTNSLPPGLYKLTDEAKPLQNARRATIMIEKDKLHSLELFRVENAHYLLKKVYGLPGDLIELDKKSKQIKVNGILLPNVIIKETDSRGGKIKRTIDYPCRVPSNFYFTATECEDGYDSRYWGLCPDEAIKGKVRLVYEFKHICR